MKPVDVIAAGCVSALGRGRAANAVAGIGERPRSGLSVTAEEGSPRGRVALCLPRPELDRATQLLLLAADDLLLELALVLPDFRARRVAIVLGTTSGAMQSMQAAFETLASGNELSPTLARAASYFSPLAPLTEVLGLPRAPVQQLLAACASSSFALGLGCRWLEAGYADLVIAGGYDASSPFVNAGFQALGALTPTRPRPFSSLRDGMALGEGAALLALVSATASGRALGRVFGFGSSSDASHVTAPDREGKGLAAAAECALADAGLRADDIDFVSAHATATAFNDAAEACALERVFGQRRLPVQPWKALIGHTLGAAGALECLAAWDALARGILPATVPGEVAEAAGVELPQTSSARVLRRALKLSAAFGGLNAALVLGSPDAESRGEARPRQTVRLRALGPFIDAPDPELVLRLAPTAELQVKRADSLSELVLTAVARLLICAHGAALPAKTAIVVGTASATLEVNECFDRRRRRSLPVEPRRFPPTSPNLCAGICSIVFGLRGPALSVGSGLGAGRDAQLLAFDLIALGDADSVIVVAVEDTGEVVRALSRASGSVAPKRGATAAWLSAHGPGAPVNRPEWAKSSCSADPVFADW